MDGFSSLALELRTKVDLVNVGGAWDQGVAM
jgi:hypothetical protein